MYQLYNVEALQGILRDYELSSGQKVNYQKSQLFFSRSVDNVRRQNICSNMGVPLGTQRGKYLGLPFLTGRTKRDLFSDVKDKVHKKLSGWKEKSLSQAGKEVLIKAVIQAIPSYAMQCFKLPQSLCDDILRMTRNFWWGQKKEERKVAWKPWDEICKPKALGGLGFRHLSLFNQALLAKQCWRILTHPDSLASLILKAKYFRHGDFVHARAGGRISFLWRSLLHGRVLLLKGLRWRVGTGNSIPIWDAPWIPSTRTFRPLVPRRDILPSGHVCDLIDHPARTWNKPLLEQLFLPSEVETILSLPLSQQQVQDHYLWHFDSKGQYTVKSGYKIAYDEWNLQHSAAAPSTTISIQKVWNALWATDLPPRIKHFLWRLGTNSLPTGDNLARRRITNGVCSVCREAKETYRHVFFECDWVSSIWHVLPQGLKIQRLTANSFLDLLSYILEEEWSVASVIFVCLWAIWYARNKAVFERKPLCIDSVLLAVSTTLASHYEHNSRYSLCVDKPQLDVKWQPPPQNSMKLNNDAAVVSKLCAVGFLIRDHTGTLLDSCSMPLPRIQDVEQVELMAILHGLLQARTLWHGSVIVESDSSLAISRLNLSSEDRSVSGLLVSEILSVATVFSHVTFVSVRRHCNKPAHLLARLGLSYASLCSWGINPPSDVLAAINADI